MPHAISQFCASRLLQRNIFTEPPGPTLLGLWPVLPQMNLQSCPARNREVRTHCCSRPSLPQMAENGGHSQSWKLSSGGGEGALCKSSAPTRGRHDTSQSPSCSCSHPWVWLHSSLLGSQPASQPSSQSSSQPPGGSGRGGVALFPLPKLQRQVLTDQLLSSLPTCLGWTIASAW